MFRTIVDQIPDPLFVKDVEGRFLFVNGVCATNMGLSAQQMIGRTDEDLFGPETVERFRASERIVMAEDRALVQEETIPLHGKELIFVTTKSPFRSPAGEPVGVLGIARDVTAQRRTEREIETLRERFRLAFERAPIGMAIAALDGRFVHVNEAFCELVGYTNEQLLARTFKEITPAEDERVGAAMRRRLLAGEVERVQYEKRYLHRDGSEIWVQLTLSMLKEGDRPFFVGHVRNITEKRRTEDALRESEERLRLLFETMSDGVIYQDADARIVSANPAAERILGMTLAEMQARAGATSGCFREEDDAPIPADRLPWCVALATGMPVRERVIVFCNEERGDCRSLLVDSVPLMPDGDGPPGRVYTTFADITGLCAAEKALRESEAHLRQAQKMEAVGRLAGGIAHDFNNILTSIGLHSELLLEDLSVDDPRRADAEEIRKAARRAADLTRQLLAYSRRQVLQPVVLDVPAVVRDMEGMLRRLIGEDIELRIRCGEADVARVKADRSQIEQVVLNLVVNSRDAMKRGGTLTIETAVEDRDRVVCLRVRDSGCGISAENLPHIFDPFFTTKERGQGTGLGLATVYGIVQQSGGEVSVDSEVGVGTTFEIRLPRVEAEVTPGAHRLGGTIPPAAGETVLLVEDEDGVRLLAERVLRKQGYRVLAAPNGPEAIRAAADHEGPIDVLLTDVIMPYMTGPELAARLADARPDTRVLYMSGYTDDAVPFDGALEHGAPLLEKPFTPAALACALRQLLEREPAPPAT